MGLGTTTLMLYKYGYHESSARNLTFTLRAGSFRVKSLELSKFFLPRPVFASSLHILMGGNPSDSNPSDSSEPFQLLGLGMGGTG